MVEEKKMSGFRAICIIEGLDGDVSDESVDQVLEALQYLVDTGIVWQLQGFYGRTAKQLIEDGLINEAS